MNTDQLIHDARLMLETIEQCHSPAFKATAARQLVDIAVEIAAQYYVPSATPEPEQPEPAESRPVIDLAMKYRTRDGQEVRKLHIDDGGDRYPFWGRVDGSLRSWDKNGFYLGNHTPCELDLIPTGERA
jgi:hypothetical protein